jgi:hypothetical protein
VELNNNLNGATMVQTFSRTTFSNALVATT